MARRFFLTAALPAAPAVTRDCRALRERFALDEQIQALKKRKVRDVDAYDAELEKLLLALALKARDQTSGARNVRRVLVVLFALLATAPAAGGQGTDSLDARFRNALGQYQRGERAESKREFERLARLYNERGDRNSARDLAAIAAAITYLGVDEPQLFKDALIVYDRAIAADPGNLEVRVKLAELFLDKYNSAEAKKSLLKCSFATPTTCGAPGRGASPGFDGEPGADSVLARALQREPENVGGRCCARASLPTWKTSRAQGVRSTARCARTAITPTRSPSVRTRDRDRRLGRHAASGRRYATLYQARGRARRGRELLARVRQYQAAADWAREGSASIPPTGARTACSD